MTRENTHEAESTRINASTCWKTQSCACTQASAHRRSCLAQQAEAKTREGENTYTHSIFLT
eukprot:1143293-Pleurochrysis_carterae.AAC.1